MDRTGGAQIVADCIPEGLQTQRIDVVDRVQPRLPAVVRNQPRPGLEWKLVEGRLVDSKGAPPVTPGEHFKARKQR